MRNLILMIVALVGLTSVGSAQYDEYGRWDYHRDFEPAYLNYDGHAKTQAALMVERWNQIGEKSNTSSWTGDYLKAFGELGTSFLRVDPTVGYVRLTTHSCAPDVRRFEIGSATEDTESMKLRPDGETGRVSTLVKVTWGLRRYLVDEQELSAFFAFATGRRVLRDDELPNDSYFVNEADLEQPISGDATVPAAYARFAMRPIVATANRVARPGTRPHGGKIRVWLDRGSSEGVRRGMVFYCESALRHDELLVEQVGKDWCVATGIEWTPSTAYPNPPEDDVYVAGIEWTTCSECYPRKPPRLWFK